MDSGTQGREFKPGDTVRVRTNVDHRANIAGVRAYYQHETDETAAVLFMAGATNEDIGRKRDEPLPGPYIIGEIVMEITVPSSLPSGVYRLGGIRFITAGREDLDAQEIPDSTIRIAKESSDPPSVPYLEVFAG